jgi:hypothetical protein
MMMMMMMMLMMLIHQIDLERTKGELWNACGATTKLQ